MKNKIKETLNDYLEKMENYEHYEKLFTTRNVLSEELYNYLFLYSEDTNIIFNTISRFITDESKKTIEFLCDVKNGLKHISNKNTYHNILEILVKIYTYHKLNMYQFAIMNNDDLEDYCKLLNDAAYIFDITNNNQINNKDKNITAYIRNAPIKLNEKLPLGKNDFCYYKNGIKHIIDFASYNNIINLLYPTINIKKYNNIIHIAINPKLTIGGYCFYELNKNILSIKCNDNNSYIQFNNEFILN